MQVCKAWVGGHLYQGGGHLATRTWVEPLEEHAIDFDSDRCLDSARHALSPKDGFGKNDASAKRANVFATGQSTRLDLCENCESVVEKAR